MLLDKCRKLTKVVYSVSVTVEVKVGIFGEAVIFNQLNDFGVIWMAPFSPQCASRRS